MLIQCGEAERLRDECILFTYKAGGCFGNSNKLPFQLKVKRDQQERKRQAKVELDMYPGMVHVFQAIPFLPESSMALQRMLEFMQRKEADVAACEETVGLEVSVEVGEEADDEQEDEEEVAMMKELEDVVIAGKWIEELVGKSMRVEDLPAFLQLREDDARLEDVHIHTSAANTTTTRA